jgi:NitT/TauT family transport system ATP-binding protein
LPNSPIVELHAVCKQFSLREGTRPVLDTVDLTIRSGEFVSIVGPSGCGKSTLLSIIAGLSPATDGRVLVRGAEHSSLVPGIGFAFQRDALLPWRTALQNVALPLRFRGVAKAEAQDRAQDWLSRVGLATHGRKYPHQLSGGMRKRVAIATMLAYDPDLVLLDEPFSALDVQTRSALENTLLGLFAQSSRTVVMITHDLEEAIAMSDRVVVMSAGPGRIVAEHTIDLPSPRDVFEAKGNPRSAELYSTIWDDLRDEVESARARELAADAR